MLAILRKPGRGNDVSRAGLAYEKQCFREVVNHFNANFTCAACESKYVHRVVLNVMVLIY